MRKTWLCLVMACGGAFSSALDGSVAASADDKPWTMTPTACYSLERINSFGVDLLEDGDEDTLVRIVLDAKDGYSVGTNIRAPTARSSSPPPSARPSTSTSRAPTPA